MRAWTRSPQPSKNFFTTHYKISSQRFCIAGYADTVPVESNDSAEGRAHNRRVDIVIVNPAGLSAESRPLPAKT